MATNAADTTAVRKRRFAWSNETSLLVFLGSLGFIVGADQISDNSMFVHLRTGIEMWKTQTIPRVDPYSFSAAGEPWLVQSWLASYIYGALHAFGGTKAVLVLNCLVTGASGLLIALLARSGQVLWSVASGLTGLLIAVSMWSPRPLMFGVVCFALMVLILAKRFHPLWLVPVMWVWVNTHGSFPAGVGFLILVIAGAWIDKRFAGEVPAKDEDANRRGNVAASKLWRYLGAALLGVAVGALNPLGPKLLTFWTSSLTRSETFQQISEWSSPDFHSPAGVMLLVGMVSFVALLWRGSPRWRYALPALMFFAATLWSVRYAPLLAIAVVAALRNATPENIDGRDLHSDKDRAGLLNVACVGLAVVVALVSVGRIATRDAMNFNTYPVKALAVLDASQLQRVAANERVGGYRIYKDGDQARVLMDDRFDMYPTRITQDVRDLGRGTGDTAAILDRYRFTSIVWERNKALSNYLRNDPAWKIVYEDDKWLTFVPA